MYIVEVTKCPITGSPHQFLHCHGPLSVHGALSDIPPLSRRLSSMVWSWLRALCLGHGPCGQGRHGACGQGCSTRHSTWGQCKGRTKVESYPTVPHPTETPGQLPPHRADIGNRATGAASSHQHPRLAGPPPSSVALSLSGPARQRSLVASTMTLHEPSATWTSGHTPTTLMPGTAGPGQRRWGLPR